MLMLGCWRHQTAMEIDDYVGRGTFSLDLYKAECSSSEKRGLLVWYMCCMITPSDAAA